MKIYQVYLLFKASNFSHDRFKSYDTSTVRFFFVSIVCHIKFFLSLVNMSSINYDLQRNFFLKYSRLNNWTNYTTNKKIPFTLLLL